MTELLHLLEVMSFECCCDIDKACGTEWLAIRPEHLRDLRNNRRSITCKCLAHLDIPLFPEIPGRLSSELQEPDGLEPSMMTLRARSRCLVLDCPRAYTAAHVMGRAGVEILLVSCDRGLPSVSPTDGARLTWGGCSFESMGFC